ncbi:cysteine-rich KTR domain-containing protein [Claveliimonas bilis]|uniref:cysteine-rich KTR domain-containing protein n=1 Tax=Claveliimonas bilis TaxID=3028070 RepID=UPI003A48066C
MQWLRCPICGNKTRNKIREDTILINYPLFCPKCKQESLIEVRNMQITVIEEPDTKMQSR